MKKGTLGEGGGPQDEEEAASAQGSNNILEAGNAKEAERGNANVLSFQQSDEEEGEDEQAMD